AESPRSSVSSHPQQPLDLRSPQIVDEICRHGRSLPNEARPDITAQTKSTSDHVGGLDNSPDAFRQLEQRVITQEIIAHTVTEARTADRRTRGAGAPVMAGTKFCEYADFPTFSSRHHVGYGILAAPTQRRKIADVFIAFAPEQWHLPAHIEQRIRGRIRRCDRSNCH